WVRASGSGGLRLRRLERCWRPSALSGLTSAVLMQRGARPAFASRRKRRRSDFRLRLGGWWRVFGLMLERSERVVCFWLFIICVLTECRGASWCLILRLGGRRLRGEQSLRWRRVGRRFGVGRSGFRRGRRLRTALRSFRFGLGC